MSPHKKDFSPDNWSKCVIRSPWWLKGTECSSLYSCHLIEPMYSEYWVWYILYYSCYSYLNQPQLNNCVKSLEHETWVGVYNFHVAIRSNKWQLCLCVYYSYIDFIYTQWWISWGWFTWNSKDAWPPLSQCACMHSRCLNFVTIRLVYSPAMVEPPQYQLISLVVSGPRVAHLQCTLIQDKHAFAWC